MPNYNSIIEAIHHHMDQMLETGLASDPSIKVQNAADALNIMGRIYLSQLDDDAAQKILNENKNLDRDIADQLSFVFDVMGSFSGNTNPLNNLIVDSFISVTEDLFGLSVNDLQNGIHIENGKYVYGTLKLVEKYTGFSIDPDEQNGYFLAIKPSVNGLDNVDLSINTNLQYHKTNDGTYVIRITDKDEVIQITATKDGYSPVTKSYLLSKLVFENEDDEVIIYDGGDGIN